MEHFESPFGDIFNVLGVNIQDRNTEWEVISHEQQSSALILGLSKSGMLVLITPVTSRAYW